MTLTPSIVEKLGDLRDRQEELSALLADPETIASRDKFTALSREYTELEPVLVSFSSYRKLTEEIAAARALLEDDDPEMRTLASDDLDSLAERLQAVEVELLSELVPKDPNDSSNVFLEIRAGTGGDEAAIFAGDLFRMYSRYAESRGWQLEVVSQRSGEHGGYKEIITRVAGRDVYGRIKFESGVHRVQRVPATESQGRIHTSACTVAVLPEVDEVEDIEIDKADLRVDTYRSSGAGGQHVNKTDSAIRLTHIPTGIVVECQDERSQHKNRARAMSLLKAKLIDTARKAQADATAESRRNLVGSGDRSERIRTYNFPQGRITDHRINLTVYQLGDVMEGELDSVVVPLLQEYQADQLAAIGATA